ncbi:MAG: hypothetical protein KDK60_03610 [Chlamydiia bacterium]|nr:hypothetical protein [Chlamydiia bacterium]
MRTMKHLFLLFTLITCSIFAIDDDGSPGLEQRDIEALRDWINTKRQVTVKERGGNLSISGEVRAELQSTNEKKNGIKQRGSGGQVKHTAMRAWDVEVNLMLDYRTDRTWATIKIEFDNNAGTVGGTFDRLSVERAFLGGRIVNGLTYTMDLEIGRRSLGYTFDSRIEFGSFMDGVLYKYSQALENVGDLYFNGGPFLVDESLDQYAYVGELGLLNIAKTGLYSKISAVYWDTKHTDKKARNEAFRFLPIQWTLGYKFIPNFLDKIVTVYGAGLYNPRAHGTVVSNGKRKAWAWYAGFSIGELRKKWDWSFDINYQWVQMQAIPDFDGSGIGRGNAAKTGLYSSRTKGEGTALAAGQGVGAGNYKGVAVELLFLLTNNITIYQAWRQSVNEDASILPTFSYKQYEFEIIYGF